ncbi:MAG: hypothetical protein LBG48_06015 [Rickettsiales bacterium]|jgi:hypothetical protein|nr:hypothetical protein [Rickettsiales bacterium]
MSENNKGTFISSINAGDMKLTQWEKYSQNGNKYYQFSITKTLYEKPTTQGGKGTYKNLLSISLNRKEDLMIIEYLIDNRKKDGISWNPYSLHPKVENDKTTAFILSKKYEDKTHEEKTQLGELTMLDILALKKIIGEADRSGLLVTIYGKENRNYDTPTDNDSCYNTSDDGFNSSTNDNNNDNNFNDKIIDDDIPF